MLASISCDNSGYLEHWSYSISYCQPSNSKCGLPEYLCREKIWVSCSFGDQFNENQSKINDEFILDQLKNVSLRKSGWISRKLLFIHPSVTYIFRVAWKFLSSVLSPFLQAFEVLLLITSHFVFFLGVFPKKWLLSKYSQHSRSMQPQEMFTNCPYLYD